MFGKISKLALGMSLIGGVMATQEQKEDVSYHMLFDIKSPVEVKISPEKEKEFRPLLDQYNEKFQSAGCNELEDTSEELIPQVKKTFSGELSSIEKIEDDFFGGKMGFPEAVDAVLKNFNGLPEAAYYLACFYDQLGAYKIALLWIKVASELGIPNSKHLMMEIFSKMRGS